MEARITKWGNSLAIRIPSSYARQVGLRDGSMVTLEPGDGGIRIVKRKYTLDEMLAGITPENIQPETDSGPDMGHEIVEY